MNPYTSPATTPISQIIALPWDPRRFDESVFKASVPALITFFASAAILNAMVLWSAVRDKRLRAEIIAFASNVIFLTMCACNFVATSFLTVVHVLSWTSGEWSEYLCSMDAFTNAFFLTLSACLNMTLTLERIRMVIYLSRMTLKRTGFCILVSIILAMANSMNMSSNGGIIMTSGLACGLVMTKSGCIVGILLMGASLSFLIVGNSFCIWRLHRMTQYKSRADLMNSCATSIPGATSASAGSKKSGLMGMPLTAMARVSAASTREERIQRSFALRGALAAVGLCVYIIPTAVITIDWAFYDRLNSLPVDVAAQFVIPAAALADPVIVLMFDQKFRSAMHSTFFWWWPQRRRDRTPIRAREAEQQISFVTETIIPSS
ncbi:hypothetical protein BC828DRAFT_383446 [Blastocladiella britannica]|nr:hypothetical protein BC828DRAFT_383446 [Blastocladiella britannica]